MVSKPKNNLPGFKITIFYTLSYLCLIVLIPISGIFIRTASMSLGIFWNSITTERVLASYKLTFGTSLLAALTDSFFGLIVSWVLVRYDFFGKKIVDTFIDLPFALPTAVAGITLASLFSPNGWYGKILEPFGIQVAYTPLGIYVALVFIGIPFVVRSIQPVLENLEIEYEEAATGLGASRWQIFSKIIFPAIFPSLISGFLLAFARGIGEYGSVVFISGNMPLISEITPLLIITRLEQYDYTGATALAVSLLLISFFIFLSINLFQLFIQSSYEK